MLLKNKLLFFIFFLLAGFWMITPGFVFAAKTFQWTDPLGNPNVSLSTESGGSLDANITYYYRVVAVNQSDHLNEVTNVYSPASVEGSILTTDENKTITVSWDAVSGAGAYYVYRTTNSDNYSGETSRILNSNLDSSVATVYPSTTSTSITDDGSLTLYRPYSISVMPTSSPSINGLNYLDYHRGLLEMSGGTSLDPITLDDIYSYFVSSVSNYQNYIYYDGYTFTLLGNFNFNIDSTEVHFEVKNKLINIFGRINVDNANTNSTINFGQLNSDGTTSNGCKINIFGTFYDGILVGTDVSIYDVDINSAYDNTYFVNGTTWLLGPWYSTIVGSTLKDVKNKSFPYYTKSDDTSCTNNLEFISAGDLSWNNFAFNDSGYLAKNYTVRTHYHVAYNNCLDLRYDSFTSLSDGYHFQIKNDCSSDYQRAKIIDPNLPNSTDTDKFPVYNWDGVSASPSNQGRANLYYSLILKLVDQTGVGIEDANVSINDTNTNGAEDFDGYSIGGLVSDISGYVWREKINITSFTSGSITDSSKSWTTNEWKGRNFYISNGDGKQQNLKVISNNSDTLTFCENFITDPSVGDDGGIVLEVLRLVENEGGRTDYAPHTIVASHGDYVTEDLVMSMVKPEDLTMEMVLNSASDISYAYSANYPISYNTSTDIFTIWGSDGTDGKDAMGFDEDNAIDFDDIKAFVRYTRGSAGADDEGYYFKTNFIFGDGVNQTFIKDNNKNIGFGSVSIPVSWRVVTNTTIILDSCGISDFTDSSGYKNIYGTFKLYNSVWTGNNVSGPFFRNNTVFDNVTLNNIKFVMNSTTGTLDRVNIKRPCVFYMVTNNLIMNDIVTDNQIALDAPYDLEISNLVSTYNAYIVQWGHGSSTITFIDSSVPDWDNHNLLDENSIIQKKYTFNLKIIDKNNNPIENARVVVRDVNDDVVFDVLSGADGIITEQEILKTIYRRNTDPVEYGPHKVTITNQNYPAREFDIEMDEAKDLTIALKDRPLSYGAVTAWGTEYATNEGGTIYSQVFYGDGTPCNELSSTSVKVTVWKTDATKVINEQDMTRVTGSNGIYRYNFSGGTFPGEGVYVVDVMVSSTDPEIRAYDSNEIHISQTANLVASSTPEDIWNYAGSIGSTLADSLGSVIWSYTGSALDTLGNAVSKVWSFADRGLTTRQIGTSTEYIPGVTTSSTVGQVANQTTQDNVEYDLELVRSATFDFAGFADGGTTSTLVDLELNEYPDDHWNNYELIMMSGDNLGEKQTVCDFSKDNYTITLCDGFDNSISSDDKYVLSHERKLVNAIWNWSARTLTSATNVAGDLWSYGGGRTLSSLGSVVSEIWDVSTTTLTTDDSIGKKLVDNLSVSTADLNTDLDLILERVGTPSDTSSSGTLFGEIKEVQDDLDQLTTINNKIDIIDSLLDSIILSRSKDYTLELSDVGEVSTSGTYRAKLSVLDYESDPYNPASLPVIYLYDSVRNLVTTSTMTELETGLFEYTYEVPISSANYGLWESIVKVDLEGDSQVSLNDYWELEGSPAQVIIRSMSDVVVPGISANITITNEGNSGYEYQYEWCVVDSESDECGGENDIDYSRAAKYINVGDDWDTELNLDVENPGNYWFKLYVYYGTEVSGASKSFTAVSSGGGSGVSYTPSVSASDNQIYEKLLEIQAQLGYSGTGVTVYEDLSNTKQSLGIIPNEISAPLYQMLYGLSDDLQKIGGTGDYDLDDLYLVSNVDVEDLDYLKNKLSELRALADLNKNLITKISNEPVVQTWYTEGSVVLNILVINPPDADRLVDVKEYLPKEIRSEHILNMDDSLILEYDPNLDSYYVSGQVDMKAGERRIFTVRAEDIFKISLEELESLDAQATSLVAPLVKTSYYAQASILKSEIDAGISYIIREQAGNTASIQKRIAVYRDDLKELEKIKSNISALSQIASEAGGKQNILGNLFGVSTSMTWGIILIVVVGVSVIAVIPYLTKNIEIQTDKTKKHARKRSKKR